MQENSGKNVCSSAPTLIFPCSGAADVGEISDRVARKLTRDGIGKIFCLAGVGAGISDFIETAQAAGLNIAIDGCSVACARKVLEKNGFQPRSYILTDMGLMKGKTPAEQQVVSQISETIYETLSS